MPENIVQLVWQFWSQYRRNFKRSFFFIFPIQLWHVIWLDIYYYIWKSKSWHSLITQQSENENSSFSPRNNDAYYNFSRWFCKFNFKFFDWNWNFKSFFYLLSVYIVCGHSTISSSNYFISFIFFCFCDILLLFFREFTMKS